MNDTRVYEIYPTLVLMPDMMQQGVLALRSGKADQTQYGLKMFHTFMEHIQRQGTLLDEQTGGYSARDMWKETLLFTLFMPLSVVNEQMKRQIVEDLASLYPDADQWWKHVILVFAHDCRHEDMDWLQAYIGESDIGQIHRFVQQLQMILKWNRIHHPY